MLLVISFSLNVIKAEYKSKASDLVTKLHNTLEANYFPLILYCRQMTRVILIPRLYFSEVINYHSTANIDTMTYVLSFRLVTERVGML